MAEPHVTRPVDAVVDVAIVGGGLVGASLALALAQSPLRVMLIEAAAHDSTGQPSFDERTTALGNASRRIFAALGTWETMARAAQPIETIHVSEAGRFAFARLRCAEQGIEAFGYVVPNRMIGAALWEALGARQGGAERLAIRVPATAEAVVLEPERARLTVMAPGRHETIEAKLIVAADGAHSVIRAAAGIEAAALDYAQTAIVTRVLTDRAHDATAYERFTPSGPIAVLPLRSGGFGVVWAVEPPRAAELLALSDEDFLSSLQDHFGWRAGRFVRLGARVSYPLKLSRAHTTVGLRSVLIGNAAQALHPVAGQGFNLGLRDAALLAEVLAAAPEDVGAAAVLEQFAERRAEDRAGVVGFTDRLVRTFADARLPVRLLRDLGLLLFDVTPPAKRALARVSLGFGGPTPRLARGLRLLPP